MHKVQLGRRGVYPAAHHWLVGNLFGDGLRMRILSLGNEVVAGAVVKKLGRSDKWNTAIWQAVNVWLLKIEVLTNAASSRRVLMKFFFCQTQWLLLITQGYTEYSAASNVGEK